MDRRVPRCGRLGCLVIATVVFIFATRFSSNSIAAIKVSPPNTRAIPIHTQRESDTDLAVTGMIAGLPDGAEGYVHYADIASLPKLTVAVGADDNFPELKVGHGVVVTGVSLEVLAKALGALPTSDLIDATCADDYRGHLPANYIAEHHPILAFMINHQAPAQWARTLHQYNPGPYFITYEHFIPAFKVLSHPDRPQVPANIARLNFSTVAATFGAIAPRGHFAQNSPQEQGFTIAKQNCLRCHNQGPYGGLKAGRTWTTLSTWAREQPAYFENYVKNPKAFEPMAKMPGNPAYDRATLDALTAYFRTFTDSAPAGAH